MPLNSQPELQPDCATVAHEAIPTSHQGELMARRRYQRGSVVLRGTRELVWIGRWREDVIGADGKTHRICRKEVLGKKRELQTKKLALRELAIRVAPINSTNYRALRVATFAEF